MNRLLELRKEQSLSQRAVAKKLYISQGTYNNWENEHTQPSIEQLIALSKLFGVSVDYIIGNSDDYQFTSVKNGYTTEEAELLQNFRNLNGDTKHLVLGIIKKLKD